MPYENEERYAENAGQQPGKKPGFMKTMEEEMALLAGDGQCFTKALGITGKGSLQRRFQPGIINSHLQVKPTLFHA